MLLIRRLRTLGRAELRADALAGLTVTFVLIPQALAYALLAGVSPVVGLYAASVPTLIYAFMGASRHMAIGPVAITSLLIASGLSGHATPGTPEYEALAVVLSTLVGVIFLLLSLLRAGVLVNFLSHPTVLGFNAGAALLTAGSQIKGFFGIPAATVQGLSPTNPWPALAHLGESHALTLGVAAVTLVLLLGFRRFAPKAPGLLLVCIAGTGLSAAIGLEGMGVAVVGDIPRGFPPIHLALPSWDQVQALLPTALSIAVVGYGASITVIKALATEPADRVQPNRELFAFGACNLASAAVGAFPVTGALARATITAQAGARTQLTGFFAGLGVVATLLVLAPAFESLPKPVLAAIIVLSASGLIDPKGLRSCYRTKRNDGLTALATLAATLGLGPEIGLLVGIIVALVFFVARTTRPHSAELGRIPGAMIYRNVNRFEVETCPQVGILRIDAPLYYANARFLDDRIQQIFAERPNMRLLALDLSSVNDMDATAVLSFGKLLGRLRSRGKDLHVIAAIGPVRDLMARSGLAAELGATNMHRSILEAGPKLMEALSLNFCETKCTAAAFPDCTTIVRRPLVRPSPPDAEAKANADAKDDSPPSNSGPA